MSVKRHEGSGRNEGVKNSHALVFEQPSVVGGSGRPEHPSNRTTATLPKLRARNAGSRPSSKLGEYTGFHQLLVLPAVPTRPAVSRKSKFSPPAARAIVGEKACKHCGDKQPDAGI